MLFKKREIYTIHDFALIINNAKIQSLWPNKKHLSILLFYFENAFYLQSPNKLRRIKNYRGSQCIYIWRDVKNEEVNNYAI